MNISRTLVEGEAVVEAVVEAVDEEEREEEGEAVNIVEVLAEE